MGIYTSKHALLSNSIDYAGTFPPAALPLEKALALAARFRGYAKNPWILGRLTCKWTDIKDLNPPKLFNAGADGSPWFFTALSSESSSVEEWERNLDFELREIRTFNARYTGTSVRLRVVGYETKIPNLSANEMAVRVQSYLDRFWESTRGAQDLYLEIPFGVGFADRLSALIGSIGKWMESGEDHGRWACGVKFRTGGQYVPSSQELATAIAQTTYARLKFKATQGLHEAVTHDKSTGFVNLFAALNIAQALGIEAFPLETIRACLEENKPENFVFDTFRFSWNKYSLTNEEIETARRFHCATFGSCSVDEPDASLVENF